MIFWISWSADPCPGPCGFDKGRSLIVKGNIKSLSSPCVTELDGWKVRGKKQFFRSFSDRQGSADHEIQKIIESPLI